MPELPEVEALRRGLAGRLIGRRVVSVAVHDRRLRRPLDTKVLTSAALGGGPLHQVDRRGKFLLLSFHTGPLLLVHLGMTGQLLLEPAGSAPQNHTHVRLELDDGWELRYRDPRRFGSIDVLDRRALTTDPRLAELGPEPLAPALTGRVLRQRAAGRRRPVKNLLLDGRFIAGIGNIYACEALFRARIRPTTPAGRLSVTRWSRLLEALRQVLDEAIEAGGTTIGDYRDDRGRPGTFQTRLAVYGREGLPCHRCGRPVTRLVMAGRSTFACRHCQR